MMALFKGLMIGCVLIVLIGMAALFSQSINDRERGMSQADCLKQALTPYAKGRCTGQR